MGWMEADCGTTLDSNTKLKQAQQEFNIFLESPNQSKYQNIIAHHEASGHGDNNFQLTNAVYRGLPVTQIVNTSAYEAGSIEISFASSVNVNSLKPYFRIHSFYEQHGEGIEFDSVNNRIVCRWAY